MGAQTMRQGIFMLEPKQCSGASLVEARKASQDYRREPLKRQGKYEIRRRQVPRGKHAHDKQRTAKIKELRIDRKATQTKCPSGEKQVEPDAAYINTNTHMYSCNKINTMLTKRAATDSPQTNTHE